jgi:TadE-like protein
MKNRRRGAALLEFAVSLPFALGLFIGIGDFSAFFWRQTRLEEANRTAVHRVLAAAPAYASIDAPAVEQRGWALEAEMRQAAEFSSARLTLFRHFACPTEAGAEHALTAVPQLCPGERVYLEVAIGQPVEPLLAPLSWIGYPKQAASRHMVRIR